MSHGAPGTSPTAAGDPSFFTSPRLRGEVGTAERSAAVSGEGGSLRVRTCRESPSPGSDLRSSPPSPGKRGEGKNRAAWRSARLLRILLVHLLEEGGGLDAPLLLELDQLAGAMPVLEQRSHELAPRALALFELHGETPWLFHDGRQRHLEAGPFRIGEALGEGRVVIDPADAVA